MNEKPSTDGKRFLPAWPLKELLSIPLCVG
jgi:hypothetical protein